MVIVASTATALSASRALEMLSGDPKLRLAVLVAGEGAREGAVRREERAQPGDVDARLGAGRLQPLRSLARQQEEGVELRALRGRPGRELLAQRGAERSGVAEPLARLLARRLAEEGRQRRLRLGRQARDLAERLGVELEELHQQPAEDLRRHGGVGERA